MQIFPSPKNRIMRGPGVLFLNPNLYRDPILRHLEYTFNIHSESQILWGIYYTALYKLQHSFFTKDDDLHFASIAMEFRVCGKNTVASVNHYQITFLIETFGNLIH